MRGVREEEGEEKRKEVKAVMGEERRLLSCPFLQIDVNHGKTQRNSWLQ